MKILFILLVITIYLAPDFATSVRGAATGGQYGRAIMKNLYKNVLARGKKATEMMEEQDSDDVYGGEYLLLKRHGGHFPALPAKPVKMVTPAEYQDMVRKLKNVGHIRGRTGGIIYGGIKEPENPVNLRGVDSETPVTVSQLRPASASGRFRAGRAGGGPLESI